MATKLSDSLTLDDVELRVQSNLKNGFTLLLYKTARTDVKRLDEVYPNLWKNKFFYDNKGLLCCEISIYNKDIEEWISRSDVGMESLSEKEKGTYSDAFKRAGFKWNIGTELYNAPFIWINWEMENVNNKWKPKNFFINNLSVSKFKSENYKIVELEITYNGNIVYSLYKKQTITLKELEQLAKNKNFDIKKISDAYNKELIDFTQQELDTAYKTLLNK